MIVRFFVRGGLLVMAIATLAADVITDGQWLGSAIGVLAATVLTLWGQRAYSYPPLHILREITKGVPRGRTMLINEDEQVRLIVQRTGKLTSTVRVLRINTADINESYSDYNTGEHISTVPVEIFEVWGDATLHRGMVPFIATFDRRDDGSLGVKLAMPPVKGERTRRAALRSAVRDIAFQVRSGLCHVTDDEAAELAAQMKGARIDPNVTWK